MTKPKHLAEMILDSHSRRTVSLDEPHLTLQFVVRRVRPVHAPILSCEPGGLQVLESIALL